MGSEDSPRALILDSGALIALTKRDLRVRSFIDAASAADSPVLIPPVAITQTVRGADALLERLFKDSYIPFVGKKLATIAGYLLAASGTSDACDAQIMAEAIRSAPSVLLTTDANDMLKLAPDQAMVRVVAI